MMLGKLRNYLKEIYIIRIIKNSGLFDKEYYLKNNLDVARSCMNPIKHYVRHGWKEGRNPNQFFNTIWYLETYPDVANLGMNPLYHYFKFGWKESRNPSIHFSTSQYLLINQNIIDAKTNPLTHCLKSEQYKYHSLVSNNLLRNYCNQIDDELLLERVREYWQKTKNKKKKVVVYTAIINNYDILKIPEVLCDDWDYVCFTDRDEIPGEHIWKIRHPDYIHSDPTRTARYIKINPHLYFPEYEYSIWIDAHILIKSDFLEKYVNEFVAKQELFGAIPHPFRQCSYTEAHACISDDKDNVDIISSQMKKYQDQGFPENYGLIESQVLVRRHNDNCVRKTNITWWSEVNKGSRRDQLSLIYALYKNDLTWTPILQSGKSTRNHEGFQFYLHGLVETEGYPKYNIPSFLPQDYVYGRKPFWITNNTQISSSKELSSFYENHIDIVICVHNALENVKDCINSVLKFLLTEHRVIIVDDGSDPVTQNYLQEVSKKHNTQIKLIRHDTSQGYTISANDGMKASDAPFIILLNSDTIVSQNWAIKLLQVANSGPDIGVVGPMSNAASWQSLPLVKCNKTGNYVINTIPTGKTVEDMNRLCEQFGSMIQYPRVPLINGFCYGIKKEVIEKIGYFDEEAFPKGYGEENDYSFRALDAGFIHVIATNCYVYHAKSKSFGNDQKAILLNMGGKMLESRFGKQRINRATESMKENPLIQKVRLRIAEELGIQVEEKAMSILPLPSGVNEKSNLHDVISNSFSNIIKTKDFSKEDTTHIKHQYISSELKKKHFEEYDLNRLSKLYTDIFPHELTLAKITKEEMYANECFIQSMKHSRFSVPKKITWFLPSFSNFLRGGIRTIFMVAEQFSEKWGAQNNFVIYKTSDLIVPDYVNKISHLFPKLIYSLTTFEGHQNIESLPKSDIAFCTSWPTAYLLARYNNCKAKFYFMQDYESLFYPAGSVQGLIEHTYKFGFYCIANTKGIADKYRLFSNEVEYYIPGIDRNIYSAPKWKKVGPPYQIVFYGRPNNNRNAFSLGMEVLTRVKAYFKDAVRIVSVGSDNWTPSKYGLQGIIENLGELRDLNEVADLYRKSHLGLVFMFTPHPSYQPFEYMACGCITVTNKNPGTDWFFKDGVNSILTSTVPDDIATDIIRTLNDQNLQQNIIKTGYKTIENMNWATAFECIENYVLNPERRKGNDNP